MFHDVDKVYHENNIKKKHVFNTCDVLKLGQKP